MSSSFGMEQSETASFCHKSPAAPLLYRVQYIREQDYNANITIHYILFCGLLLYKMSVLWF